MVPHTDRSPHAASSTALTRTLDKLVEKVMGKVDDKMRQGK